MMESQAIQTGISSTLDKRRTWLYTLLLLGQTLGIISHLVMIPAAGQPDTLLSVDSALVIDLIILLMITGINVLFISYFFKKKLVFVTLVILWLVSIIINFVFIEFNLLHVNPKLFRLINGLASLMNLFMLSITFYYAVKDIFGEKLKIGQSLLGAANIYILIGSIFSFIYAIFNIIMPGTLVPLADVSIAYHLCFVNSSYVLAGQDVPYNDIPNSMRNLMVFESLFAHLFAVFIVGRLLAKQST